ncbi:unnamed protein product [Schistosoma rodhaini]|uniref:Tetraspanin n=1 Tax=Schistosoma rodhaini TaxID=6188 RepID=A0AA85ESV2_9TREM|nr:unnamed protein product [Schistosoma rodhaini]CAH8492898.1 unnamed protein product [Schistosoma rodhaini]
MLLSSESWTKLFILCNCSFIAFSIVLLALGIQPEITINQFSSILHSAKPIIFIVVCISGGLGVLGSCVGIYGYLKQRKIIIYLNIFVLIVVTCMWIGMGMKLAVAEDEFPKLANSSLSAAVKEYTTQTDYQMELDKLQKSFHCCGSTSSKDYTAHNKKAQIPSSCKYNTIVFSKGCTTVLSEYTQHYLNVIMYLCFIFGIIQVIYLVMSIMKIRKFEDGNSLSA